MLCCHEGGHRVDFGKVLSTLVTFFAREGFRFAAVGAFAMHAYGLSRATIDLDVATEAQARFTGRRATPTISTRIRTSGGSISCT
jgi:hypothetical protein